MEEAEVCSPYGIQRR
ncbi:hypothetical protein A2U01_0110852, partial [Trifolium medium]|nr:hypothetical protein [Trifolium medium]